MFTVGRLGLCIWNDSSTSSYLGLRDIATQGALHATCTSQLQLIEQPYFQELALGLCKSQTRHTADFLPEQAKALGKTMLVKQGVMYSNKLDHL